jgi:citrate lyase subunit beta / citryl-CoA lyase
MSIGPTMLFVPGDRPTRIAKALASSADSVCIDLEDAVVDAAKVGARQTAVAALRESDRTGVLLRINSLATRWGKADLAASAPILSRLVGIVVPKVESAAQVHAVAEILDGLESESGLVSGRLHVVPILESAHGILAAPEIAAADRRVVAIIFGTLDLSSELGIDPTLDGMELLYARSRVVLAAAAAGGVICFDGPHTSVEDLEGLRHSTRAARVLGFGGRTVLTPRHINTVRSVFGPSPEELTWAHEVLAAHQTATAEGTGAVRLPDGTFIDRPVVVRARKLLAQPDPAGPN